MTLQIALFRRFEAFKKQVSSLVNAGSSMITIVTNSVPKLL